MRKKRAKALPGSAAERRPDRVLRQAGMAVAARDLARQHRPDSAMDVPDRPLDAPRFAPLDRRLRLGDQLVVERLVEMVLLALAIVDRDARLGPLLVQPARRGDARR